MNVRRWFPLVAVALLTAACGDDDPVGPDVPVIKANPSFVDDINDVLQRNGCSSGDCHGADGGRAGLELTTNAAANYAQLVGVEASLELYERVEPGDAENSYLVIKVEGRQMVGQRMPIDLDPLDNVDLTNLKNWINNGAPNN